MPLLIVAILYLLTGPVGTMDGDINSDTAIPVLMANSDIMTWYQLYYYGQDRFGGFFFLALNTLHRSFGVYWYPHHLYLFQLFLLSAGIWLMRSLVEYRQALIAAAFVLAIVCGASYQQWLFEINNPYAFMLFLCFAYAFALNRALSSLPVQRHWFIFAIVINFLACWISPASFCLVLIFAIMACFWFSYVNTTETRRMKSSVIALTMASACVGLAGEKLLRQIYNRYVENTFSFALSHYNFHVNTPMDFRFNQIWRNFAQIVGQIYQVQPLSLCALLFDIIALGILLRLNLRISKQHARPWFMLLTLVLASGAHLLALGGVAWISDNGFSLRYMIPSLLVFDVVFFFLLLSSIAQIVRRFMPNGRDSTPALAWLILLSLLVGSYKFSPLRDRMQVYDKKREEAHHISAEAGGNVLILGPYWKSYVWQALNPEKLIGVPFASDPMRVPIDPHIFAAVHKIVSCEHLPHPSQFSTELIEDTVAWKSTSRCELYKLTLAR